MMKKEWRSYQWRLYWYRYSRCPESNDIIYGDRMLIQPSPIPCSSKFIQWSTLLPLHEKLSASLVGTFSAKHITMDNRVQQRMHKKYWDLLVGACSMLCILPPTIQVKQQCLLHKKRSAQMETINSKAEII